MTTLALWFLASFGAAFVLGHSKISLPLRQWLGGWTDTSVTNDLETGQVMGHVQPHKPAVPVLGPVLVALVECPGCLGWWLGFVVGALSPMMVFVVAPTLADIDASPRYVAAVVLSFATSAVNLLLAKYVGMV